MKEELTPVYLNPEEAAVLVLMMKHYDKISFMCQNGVFDIRNGSFEAHFDAAGNLHNIVKREVRYPQKIVLFA